MRVKDIVENTSKLNGKTVVFTGKLEHSTREQAKKTAERSGLKVVSQVSEKNPPDYVVVGSFKKGETRSAKYDAAKKLGIPIKTESEWADMLHDLAGDK